MFDVGNVAVPLCVWQKITTKNAFGLHLIDYMADILKQKDSELTNFKVGPSLVSPRLAPDIDGDLCLV